MKSAVITFPGSNCDMDMFGVLKKFSLNPVNVWHKDSHLSDDVDLIAIPGGFSYGDYLRSGGIAACSNIMQEVVRLAKKGKYVIGICNGFQILTEARLLDGALIRNKNLKFLCKNVDLVVENNSSFCTSSYYDKENVKMAIAHHDGNYYCSSDSLKSLQDNDQIAFRYRDDVNGSLDKIAGIYNKNKNVLGMMPHPERSSSIGTVGDIGGTKFFESILSGLNS